MFRSFFHKFPDCRQIRKMSFWYSIYYVLSTSASWKRAEQIEISGTFLDTFSEMATDTFFHRFWVDLDSILGCFLVLKSEKMDTKKDSKNIPAKKSCDGFRRSREIRAWVLWSLKTIQRSQIQGLANLTKALETLHWCLAARWRIVQQPTKIGILHFYFEIF